MRCRPQDQRVGRVDVGHHVEPRARFTIGHDVADGERLRSSWVTVSALGFSMCQTYRSTEGYVYQPAL